ncbi:MAG: chemotaxis protein CheA [Treponema sp.]|nr:chemotaxis protein CheA [Treponema sp.]
MKFDSSIFLGDFEAEARIHIEKIETAFLDISTFSNDLKLMNSVFRAAHSIKGTAGFLSLEKIVAVTHELENILSQIKDDIIIINDEIADIVLQCVDKLKELLDFLHNDEEICIKNIIKTLKNYTLNKDSDAEDTEIFKITPNKEANVPFNLNDEQTEKTLKSALKRGHKIYYVNIDFNRSLGKYYKNPRGMIEDIFSIGIILQAIVDCGIMASSVIVNSIEKKMENSDNTAFTNELVNVLKEHDTSTLEMLITSVLDLNLFSAAIGVDEGHIYNLSDKIKNTEEYYSTKQKFDKNKTLLKDNNLSIRLNIMDINRIMDLANELILTRNQLFSFAAKYKKAIPGFAPLLHDINHLTSEIHERIMFTRMQPISIIFNKFPRIIHDTAKALNKDIALNVLRDDITLDKYLLEDLTDPITQLVKNSADHGIESAAQRVASGKPKTGTITLNAAMRDGSAIIEVIDDGRGLDVESLKSKAIELGIETEETLALMQKKEIYNLIFRPGISTAKQVTKISGRGVGMDIVKNNIEKSGGSIEIESKLGVGTTVQLKMPLTLSVINTLIVNIDSISYAVPESNVEYIVRIYKENASIRLEKINKSLVLIYNGQIIPVTTMNEIEAKAKGTKPISADKILEKYLAANVTKCLILRAEGRRFAVLIDNALDSEQVLVKPLPIYLKNCPCYSNVTVLGNGKAVTILNASEIMQFMGIENIEKDVIQQYSLETEKTKKTGNKRHILIFMCSGKEYYSIDMIDILRIELIKAKDIQEINGESFINITGITWRIVRPENFVPVEKLDYTKEKLFLVILKNALSVGFLVKNVIDKTEDEFSLDNKQIYSDFIYGTGVYNEKVLIFLNPYAITEHVENEKINRKNIMQGSIL